MEGQRKQLYQFSATILCGIQVAIGISGGQSAQLKTVKQTLCGDASRAAQAAWKTS